MIKVLGRSKNNHNHKTAGKVKQTSAGQVKRTDEYIFIYNIASRATQSNSVTYACSN